MTVDGQLVSRGRGRPKGTGIPPAAYAAKYSHIIEARRSGKTLQEIGWANGITYERVRQIIARHGDKSLIGVKAECRLPAIEAKRKQARAKRRKVCKHCGTAFIPSNSKPSRRFCSRACWYSSIETIHVIGPELLTMRREGKKWQTIANELGFSSPACAAARLHQWKNKYGVDVSDVMHAKGKL